ncbi:MAG: BON domain-containing protein [Planctomycetia bacterium]|nr:BON domain-containing protein [Planctomycetia bacterium]
MTAELLSVEPLSPELESQIDELSELNRRLASALARNPYLARRHVRAEAADGRIRLHGVVGSYYQKQMAQELLRNVDGVGEIDNRIEVTWV